tara:strand:+ start:489 stop:1040 length:552 start_codon:yes stop_codon:yes gene_type:complete
MKKQIQKVNKLEKNLTLTGMMGVGKTSLGKKLAKRLKYSFVDIDDLIEKKEGQSINLIFKNKGEDYFRRIEKKITIEELKKNKCVISLGGGGFLSNKVRKITRKFSVSFWLDVPIEKLIKRLKNSKKRPLLNKENKIYNIKKIYFARKKIYNQANYRIKCKELSTKQISEKILNFYETSRNKI